LRTRFCKWHTSLHIHSQDKPSQSFTWSPASQPLIWIYCSCRVSLKQPLLHAPEPSPNGGPLRTWRAITNKISQTRRYVTRQYRYDITEKTLRDITLLTRCHVTRRYGKRRYWQDATWQEVTGKDITWREVTDKTSRDETLLKRRYVTRRYWQDITWQDVTDKTSLDKRFLPYVTWQDVTDKTLRDKRLLTLWYNSLLTRCYQ